MYLLLLSLSFKLNDPSLLVLERSPLLATARSWMALGWRKMHRHRLQMSIQLLLHDMILLCFWMIFSRSYEDSKHMLMTAWIVSTHALTRWTSTSTSLQMTWTSFAIVLIRLETLSFIFLVIISTLCILAMFKTSDLVYLWFWIDFLCLDILLWLNTL